MGETDSGPEASLASRLWVPLLALALTGIGLLRTRAPLKSARPNDTSWVPPPSQPGSVEARLWEDPFRPISGVETEGAEALGPEASQCLPGLERKNEARALLLPVMLPGGTYAEDEESRLRARRAVLMALAAEGFVPEQSDRLRYLERDDWKRLLPYEVFRFDSSAVEVSLTEFTDVVVAWINESLVRELGTEPGRRINVLDGLGRILSDLQNRVHHELGDGSVVSTRIVGPSDTGMLEDMLEADAKVSPRFHCLFWDTELHSPLATIASSMIPGLVEHTSVDSSFDKVLPRTGLSIHRTILTDDTVVQALLRELRLRRAIPESCEGRMVLVYEWDTEYGRALRQLFRQSIACESHGGRPSQAGFCDCSTCSQERNPGRAAFEPCPHLKTIGYMRGLDGRQPGGRSKVDPSDRSTGESDRNAHDDQDQPFGTSQLDDARRLASRLSQEEDSRLGGRHILSIGILGSDLYDKLLLLRALRPEFPQAVFFTTDLDARLLMSDEQPFVRNLVVASARGLTTARDIQSVLPSFRDSYQTSVYATCREILQCSYFKPLHVTTYEIGRTTATQLGRTRGSRSSETLHVSIESSSRLPVVALGLLASIVGIYGQKDIFRKWWRQLESGREVFYRRMTAIIVASAVLVFACVYYGSHLPDGEPFALWEGISAWPTEILRAVAIVLAIWLLFDAESHLCTNAAKIRGDYFGPEHRGERKGTGGVAESSTIGGLFRRVRESMPRASGIVAKHKTALSAWKAYERNECLGRRLSSVSWFILLFVAPCCLAYLFFGWPMKPVRGTFCWVIDFVFELAAFFCIAFLTLAVLDRCIAVRLLVKSLTSEEAKWHPAALNRYSAEIPGGCEAAGHWLDIEVLAKRTAAVERTLYGPFVLVVLLGISRDSNFDNWGWPVVFIVIEAVLLAAAIVSVGMLRHSAELARREALSRLDESTEKARGEREQGEHEVELLNRLAERVRNERRGAFSPFLDNPVLRALLIPLTGFGSWRVIQTFFQ